MRRLWNKLFGKAPVVLCEGEEAFEELKKVWRAEAQKQNLATLPKFLRHLSEDYTHDYGTICHAMAIGGEAAMWAMNKGSQGGITGFQAGAVMWEFIRSWMFSSNKTGLRLTDNDHFLYPQYAYEFDRGMSKETWAALQKEAQTLLAANEEFVAKSVMAHWQSIADGNIPFDYFVRTE